MVNHLLSTIVCLVNKDSQKKRRHEILTGHHGYSKHLSSVIISDIMLRIRYAYVTLFL